MERRDFVSHIGMTLTLACIGGLAACSKGGGGYGDSPQPAPGGATTALTAYTITVNGNTLTVT